MLTPDAPEYDAVGHSAHHAITAMLQDATKPSAVVLPSDAKTTCMKPVDELNVVSALTALPDSFAISFVDSQSLDEH